MTSRPVTLNLPDLGPAVLPLPVPLTPHALGCLEHALATALRDLRREAALAGRDPGAIEVDSWVVARHTAVQGETA